MTGAAKAAPGPTADDRPRGRRSRQTQAERSAATRGVLLDAAIKCLFEHGYATTTTTLVAQVAGVSRGAMLHQFPSKAELMTYVVEAVFAEDVGLYGEMLRGIEGSRDRLLAYPMAVWKLMGRPAGVATLEIFQGSRSDDVLAEMLRPVQERIDASAVAALEAELHRAPSIPLMQLIVAVGRGLAIGGVISPTDSDGRAAVELFEDLVAAGIDRGILLKEELAAMREQS
ncbi:TetR/AcrR family transcriptional regulator [Sphingopyxis sp.]|jgi:AcrR family transcriptional regulator|uniref:TetR/AcrR family transcriptional regulator n=1 Tax=Sphingopyxis sp. TaxID=1908224 RepID=UPI002DE7A6CF|nr:TetR/AcrR family transcriptional regulator [Sphingopyxis sp.]